MTAAAARLQTRHRVAPDWMIRSMSKRSKRPRRIAVALVCALAWTAAHGQSTSDATLAAALRGALNHPPPLPRIEALAGKAAVFAPESAARSLAAPEARREPAAPQPPVPDRAAQPDARIAPPAVRPTLIAEPMPAQAASAPGGASTGLAQPVSLREALRRAATGSIQVVLEAQKLLNANADLKASDAPFLPQLSLSAQVQKYGNLTGQPGTNLVGSTLISTMGSVYTNYVSLMASYNIYDGGKDQASQDAAQSQVLARRESLDDTRNRAVLDTLFAYTALRDAQARADAQREVTALTGRTLALVRERYKRGAASLLQVNQADSDRSRAGLAYADAMETLQKRSADLAQLIALPLEPGETLVATDEVPLPPVDGAATFTADLIGRMPAVRSAAAELAQARAMFAKARDAYGPQVNLTASYNWLGSSGQSSVGEILGHAKANNYVVGLTISQPLFPFVGQDAEVDKAGAAVMTAQARLADARVAAAAKLARAEAELERGRRSAALAQDALQQAQSNLQLTQALYAKGRASLADLDQMRMAQVRAGAEADAARQQLRSAQWAMFGLTHPAELLSELRLPAPLPQARAADQGGNRIEARR